VQVFDTFKRADWEHSYALMVGNGNGIDRGDNDNNQDFYAYWSSEKVFGGQGPRREGWKLFAWYQTGDRRLTLEHGNADPSDDETRDFNRTRWGLGTTLRKGKYRAAAEYIKADGMIFNGTDAGAVPGAFSNNGLTVASNNMEPQEKADGWYLDFGYRIHPKWELDVRYDTLNRATETPAKERKFDTWTLGAQYFLNKKSRLILNYEIRDAEAPNLPSTDTANRVLDSMDDRISLQLLVIF
jgi:predicted porin